MTTARDTACNHAGLDNNIMETVKTTNPTTKIFRSTKQRDAIKKAFTLGNASNRLLSPAEVLEKASKEAPNLGIATVYRNIKTMLEKGEIKAVALPGQADRYVLSDAGELGSIRIDKDGTVVAGSMSMLGPMTGYTRRTYLIEE